MKSEHHELVYRLGFVNFTQKGPDSTTGLGHIEKSSVCYYFETHSMQQNKRPASGSESRKEKWALPGGLPVFTQKARVPLQDWETFKSSSVCWWIEVGFADLNYNCRVRLCDGEKLCGPPVSVITSKSIPMQGSTQPTGAPQQEK